MRRRTLLAGAGTTLGGLAGCLGTFDAGSPPSTPTGAATTCTDPPWSDPVVVDGTPNTSKEGNMTGFTYVVEVENENDEGEVLVAVRFAETTHADCARVAFQRVFELGPHERDILRDPLDEPGEYTLIAETKRGDRATADVRAFEDGISSARAYFVEVRNRSVTIQTMES